MGDARLVIVTFSITRRRRPGRQVESRTRSRGGWLEPLRGRIDAILSRFSSDPESLHLRDQRCGLYLQQSSSAVSAVDLPAASLQRLDHNCALAHDQLVQRKVLLSLTV